jgi:hypothetical protein
MGNEVKKSLKDRAVEMSSVLPFLDGREKGQLKGLIGNQVTINQFGFLMDNTKNEEYVAFTIVEDEKRFYFGGMVLTDQLKTLENEGFRGEIEKDGLPALFTEKKGKKHTYTDVKFYPEEV